MKETRRQRGRRQDRRAEAKQISRVVAALAEETAGHTYSRLVRELGEHSARALNAAASAWASKSKAP